MERLISLFREADYERWSLSPARREPVGLSADEEPVYFRQLLGYLREQRSRARHSTGPRQAEQSVEAQALIGTGD